MDWWDLTVRFFSLADANVRYVLAGSVLLGGSAGGLGTFAFLQRRSLIGDALAHAALPGIGLAFLVAGRKDYLLLLLGAAVAGWLGALAVNGITRYSRLKQDAALGIVLTSFFGLGIVLLTRIQKVGAGAQAGLDKFLFGQASALGADDVRILAVVALLLLGTVLLWFSRFKIISFDPAFARSIGLPVGVIHFTLTTLIVFAVTIGLQAVGVVLMAAMLITPAAAARQWTDRLGSMIVLASAFGIASGIVGAYVSFLAPKLPTGPWMVVAVSVFFVLSLLFSPKRGVVIRAVHLLQRRRRMAREHLLKAWFKAGVHKRNWNDLYPVNEIRQFWSYDSATTRRLLRRLNRRGLIERVGGMYRLSEEGRDEGARITRLHRLWEVYLTRYLELPQDHVHRDAEEIEHVITPEIEERLTELLDRPERDPHEQEIPYIDKERSHES